MALAVQLFLLGAFAVTFGLTLAILLFLLFAQAINFALCLGQHPQIMFGVLRVVFRVHTVVRQLRIAVQLVVFFNDLLRRAAHLAFGAGAVEHPIDDATAGRAIVVAVLIAPRP